MMDVPRIRPPLRVLGIFSTVVLTLFGACGGEEPTPPASEQQQPSESGGESTPAGSETQQSPTEASDEVADGETVEARVLDTEFKPLKLTVAAGTTVKWTQTGLQPHSVTAADAGWDSSPDCSPVDVDECLGEGDAFSFQFDEPGSYLYYCRVHGLPDGTGMVGRVIVE